MPPRRTSPGSAPPAAKLLGRAEPRLFTPPLRPLTRKTTRGYEIIDFARDVVGEPLLPWQEFAVKAAFELLPNGRYRFRTVLIIVARQNGKSHLKRVVTLWRMYMDGATQILGTAHRLSLARKQWNLCQETIRRCPDLAAEWGGVRNVNGDEMFWASGAEYAIASASDAGRGSSNDEVTIDELRIQKDWKAWAALSKTTSARPYGQTWAMSNAGDDTSVVLNQLREVGIAGTDPSLCLLEWSAPDGCELDDRDAIAQANPALGTILSEAAIRSSLGTDPPAIFRTEVLCQRVQNLNSAIDIAAWRDCADQTGTMDALRGRIALCFDVAEDSGHATLAAAAVLTDGRVRIEIVRAWHSTTEALDELGTYLDAIKPRAIAWYPSGPGGAFATILRKHRRSLELSNAKAAEACQGLADIVRARNLIHPADELLDAHIGAASKQRTGDGWRFTRRDTGHCDAAYAAAGATYAALTLPKPRRPQIRIMSA